MPPPLQSNQTNPVIPQTPTTPTEWKFYSDNPSVWVDMLAACEQATKTIDLEQFIFDDEGFGKIFIDVCERKAREGVKIRFMWDAAGSFNLFGGPSVSDMSKKGIEVRFFNTFIPRSVATHRWWFFRNHRRSLVVDSTTAFIGSHSIWEKTRRWQEANLQISGPIVADISAAFKILWDRAGGIKTRWNKNTVATPDGFSYITNNPVPRKRFMYSSLIEAIRGAQTYICLVTPYFVPDHRLLRVLRLAARRGVDVRLILPEKSDHKLVDLGGQSFYAALLKSGVHIYHLPEPFVHAKVSVVDSDWATVGTMNLDNVSLRYNFEANVVSTDKNFVSELHKYCVQHIQKAKEIHYGEWINRSFTQQWLEIFIIPIRWFL